MSERVKSLRRPQRTEHDREIARLLSDDNHDEETKDAIIKREAAKVRATWKDGVQPSEHRRK